MSKGTPRTFNVKFEETLKAARESVIETGLAMEEVYPLNKWTWVIISKNGVSVFSWGELVRVVEEKLDDEVTEVRVFTKRKLATNVTAKGDYSITILSNMQM